MYHSAIGKIRRIDGVVYVVTEEGETGCIVYGPYRVLNPGVYEVQFDAMPQDFDGRTCCVFDILRRGLTIVTEKDFTADELIHRNGQVQIRFEVIRKDVYEFRAISTGTAALKVRYQRPLRLLSTLTPDGVPEEAV